MSKAHGTGRSFGKQVIYWFGRINKGEEDIHIASIVMSAVRCTLNEDNFLKFAEVNGDVTVL